MIVANSGLLDMNQEKGFAISIFVHLLIIVAVVSTTSTIQATPKVMVVDFSIIESYVKANTIIQSNNQLTLPDPPVVKPAKKLISSPPKPVPIKKVIQQTPKPKIVAIKQKTAPPLKPKPEPESELTPEPLPPSPTPQVEEAPLLADNAPAISTPVEPGSTKPSFSFPAPSAGASRANNNQTTVSKYTKAHFSRIQQGIQQQINYPRAARRMGWEGRVVIEFIICKDGTVKNIHIVESSGFKALDKNAVATIKKAAPFPIPPIAAKLIIPVVYRLS